MDNVVEFDVYKNNVLVAMELLLLETKLSDVVLMAYNLSVSYIYYIEECFKNKTSIEACAELCIAHWSTRK